MMMMSGAGGGPAPGPAALNPLTAAALFLPPAGMQPTGASGESKESILSSHSSLGGAGKTLKDKVIWLLFVISTLNVICVEDLDSNYKFK